MAAHINRRLLLLAGGALLLAYTAHAASPALAIKVYKDPYCGCCTAWAERLRSAGFKVDIEERDDMDEIKKRFDVPDDLTSCHTGVIGGYVIEGHVPPNDIKRLVAKKSDARGLAVPGMPVNSPGMEVPEAEDDPYTVWLFRADGTRSAFAHYGA